MDAQTDKEAFPHHAYRKGALFGLRPASRQKCLRETDIETATQNGISIDRFNGLAAQSDWPVLIDPLCRFTYAKLSAANALWQCMAGTGLPRRQDMTARLLQPYIPQLTIYERLQGPDHILRFRVRLMGTNSAQFTQEMTGHYIDEILSQEHLSRWLIAGQTVLRHGAPLRLLYRGDSFNKKHVVGEAFVAPLLTTDGRPDLIMAITVFEGGNSWEAIAARTRRQLAEDEAGQTAPA